MNTRQQLSFSFRIEEAQIHFLSHLFVAVAITVAPYWQQNTLYYALPGNLLPAN